MNFESFEERFNEISLMLHYRLERAELQIPRLNETIERITRLGIVHDLALIGDVLTVRPYAAETGILSTGQVLVTTLLLPGGAGATTWDTEDHRLIAHNPEIAMSEARSRFRSFEDLSPGEKALMSYTIGPLVQELSRIVLQSVTAMDN